jgi:hypothetical protein
LLILLGGLLETRRLDEAERCLAEIVQIPGQVDRATSGDINVREAVLCLHRSDPHRAVQLLHEATRCFSSENMTLAHGFCLGNLSVAYRRAGNLEASLQSALAARETVGGRFGPSCEAEMTAAAAAAYVALGRHHDALAVLDASPAGEQVRSRTRAHVLALRAIAASAASPSAAAAFLLEHADEFARPSGPHDDQAVLLLIAVQEIAYRMGAFETAERLLVRHSRLWPDGLGMEISPPGPAPSWRLGGHPPPGQPAPVSDQAESSDIFHAALAALTDLTSAPRRTTSRKPDLDSSSTAGTRMMIIPPHSAPS